MGDQSACKRLPFAGVLKDSMQSDFALAQVARLARSLPVADVRTVRQACVKHREVLTSTPLPDPGAIAVMVNAVRNRVAALASEKGFGLGVGRAKPLTSASYRSARAEGGQSKDVSDGLGVIKYVCELNPAAGAAAAWRGVVTDSLEPSERRGNLPRARQVGLAERGCKARVITAMETGLTSRGHVLRDVFWPLVEAEPVFALSDESEQAAIQRLKVCSEMRFVSTDLTAATDYAPFVVARAVWQAVTSGLVDAGVMTLHEATDVVEEISEYHLGPHVVESKVVGEFQTSRGWLMGHPLTWFTLSWLHFGAAALTVGTHGIAIKGDDAVAVGTPDQLDSYMRMLERLGMVINRSKTFVSRRAVVFCERTYTLHKGVFKPLRDISVKTLVAPSTEGLGRLARDIETLNDTTRRRACRIAWRNTAQVGLLTQAKRYGVPLSLPRELGGLGLPRRGGLPSMLSSSRRWASIALTGKVQPKFYASKNSYTAWDYALEQIRTASKTRHSLGLLGFATPIRQSTLGAFAASAQLGIAIAKGAGKRESFPSLKIVGRRFARWRQRVSHCHPPKMIQPALWSWSRLDGMLAACALQGLYGTQETTYIVSSGVTLAEMVASFVKKESAIPAEGPTLPPY